MPTPEVIKELAEQYSELTDGSPADKAHIRAIAQCFTEWLSKDYCIVPKSNVKDEYEFAMFLQYSSHKADQDYGSARETLLERLFGTELFNE